MNKQEAIKHAEQYFNSHPSVNEFFITTDGQAFFNEEFAFNHAHSTLKDNIVHTVKRDEKDEVIEVIKLSKEGSLEKAKKQLEDAEAALVEKKTALAAATSKTKGAATTALNKAQSKVDAAKAALALVEELPE